MSRPSSVFCLQCRFWCILYWSHPKGAIMNTKICTKCKIDKPLDMFSYNRGKPRPRCKECRVKEASNYYRNNLEDRKKYHKKRLKKLYQNDNTRIRLNQISSNSRKKKIVRYREFMKTKICSKCGFNDYRALQWHHRNPSEKSFTVASQVSHTNWDKLMSEIRKCDCLCANCHFILHHPDDLSSKT